MSTPESDREDFPVSVPPQREECVTVSRGYFEMLCRSHYGKPRETIKEPAPAPVSAEPLEFDPGHFDGTTDGISPSWQRAGIFALEDEQRKQRKSLGQNPQSPPTQAPNALKDEEKPRVEPVAQGQGRPRPDPANTR